MTRPPAVEFRAVSKSFGPVQANRAVSLTIAAGSIAGIIGENGAGKSTLMGLLYGLHPPDDGDIVIGGQPVRIRSPRDAIRYGIGMVHQHFLLVEPLSVLDNVMLGAEGGPLLRADRRASRRALAQLGEAFGLSVDPDATVGELPVGAQQRVEILKALHRGARILILDEPTGVLTPQEADRLFDVLRALQARGTTIILITHKLREIMAVTDTVHVMRRGSVVAQRRTADTNHDELAELMVGRKVARTLDKAAARPGTPMLVAEGLGLRDRGGAGRLDRVDLTLRAGEIVGVAGVAGNGQSELLELLAGMRAPTAGRIVIGTRTIDAAHPASPAELRALGIAHVPEDRRRHGLVGAFEARETAILGYHGRTPVVHHGLLDRDVMTSHCRALMTDGDVRPAHPRARSDGFSGGNQQKLILAREIAASPRVLLVGQPTRGVDNGAIELIHRRLIALRDAGWAILVVSVELDELRALADRILVMAGGRIAATVDPDIDERRLGLMLGHAWDAMPADATPSAP